MATALPDRAKVVVPEGEFTSVVFPWAVHADRGVEVITAPVAKLAEAIDASTTLVAFSLVQSASGELAPFDDILAAARHHGALIAVDGTQSCGWLPFDASAVDAMATHTYKWMMSPRGASLLVLRPELRERMRPLAAGWFAGDNPHTSYYGLPLRLATDARRFDTSPAWFSWVGTQPTLEVIEKLGVENIRDHDVRLANRLRQGLELEPSNSAIVSVDIDGRRAEVGAGRNPGRHTGREDPTLLPRLHDRPRCGRGSDDAHRSLRRRQRGGVAAGCASRSTLQSEVGNELGHGCEHVPSPGVCRGNAPMPRRVEHGSDGSGVIGRHLPERDAPPIFVKSCERDHRSLRWHDFIRGTVDEEQRDRGIDRRGRS